jgi:hypothetical protein
VRENRKEKIKIKSIHQNMIHYCHDDDYGFSPIDRLQKFFRVYAKWFFRKFLGTLFLMGVEFFLSEYEANKLKD